MKTKTYHYGKTTCKTHFKTAGNGWETTFVIDGKPVFVGNFIHSGEASRWFNVMNHEIKKFGKKYTVGHNFPTTWFKHFITNHLYKFYYAYLDKVFVKYNRNYSRAWTQNVRQFKRLKNTERFATNKRVPWLKSA